MEEYLNEMGIEHRLTTPVWSRANGEVERRNRSLLKSMSVAQAEKRDWRLELNKYHLAYRSTPHVTTGQSRPKISKCHKPWFRSLRRAWTKRWTCDWYSSSGSLGSSKSTSHSLNWMGSFFFLEFEKNADCRLFGDLKTLTGCRPFSHNGTDLSSLCVLKYYGFIPSNFYQPSLKRKWDVWKTTATATGENSLEGCDKWSFSIRPYSISALTA